MPPVSRPDAPGRGFRLVRKCLLSGVICYLVLSAIAGVIIADASLKLRRLPLRHQQSFAATVAAKFHASLQNVSIAAADGAVLKAWYVHPAGYNGSAVLLLHGI